jgi:glycerol-3-phosphate dehydrogenase
VHGFHPGSDKFGHLSVYGSDAAAVQSLGMAEPLHAALPYTGAEVVWAARHEMARTLEDVLARRTRALFLNARAAIEMAPAVAHLCARELERSSRWETGQVQAFTETARNYLP